MTVKKEKSEKEKDRKPCDRTLGWPLTQMDEEMGFQMVLIVGLTSVLAFQWFFSPVYEERFQDAIIKKSFVKK